MTSTKLKIIACITMLIDHIGAVLYPEVVILRMIGRIAFPIFAFLIAEGYYHTKNPRKYLLRLGLFAIISEIPFDLAFNNKVLEFSHQNVFFTLCLGLLAIHLFTYFYSRQQVFASGSVIICMLIAFVLRTDYSLFGILLIFAFYKFRDDKILRYIIPIMVLLAMTVMSLRWDIVACHLISMLFIYLYNGKKGYSLKYLFYIFYPAHLLVLFLINNGFTLIF